MEVNQSATSSIAERIILPMKRHLVVNFSVTLGVQHTLIHETFLLLIQLFPLKSRRMSNPLHDVKVTWFNLMCPKHKILPNLYICKKGRWSAWQKTPWWSLKDQKSRWPSTLKTGRFQIIRNYYEICLNRNDRPVRLSLHRPLFFRFVWNIFWTAVRF